MTDLLIDGRMRNEEVERRFPEVSLIEDDELRDMTTEAIGRMTPDYFWEVPATGSGRYHNPFSRRKHGLWIHVKMTMAAYERLVRSYVEQGLITEREADLGRAAVLLHDNLKYGHSYEDGDSTVSNHDKLAATWIRANTDLPSEVANAVEAHNGNWYDGKSPEEPLEQLVHMADMVASTKNITCGVWKPADEIKERFPNIPRVDL